MIPQNLKDKLLKFDVEAAQNERDREGSECSFMGGSRYQHQKSQATLEELIKILDLAMEANSIYRAGIDRLPYAWNDIQEFRIAFGKNAEVRERLEKLNG